MESTQGELFNLTLSVKELAISVKNMFAEQKKQGERIQALESEPAERYRLMQKTLVTSILSAIGGAIGTAILLLLKFN